MKRLFVSLLVLGAIAGIVFGVYFGLENKKLSNEVSDLKGQIEVLEENDSDLAEVLLELRECKIKLKVSEERVASLELLIEEMKNNNQSDKEEIERLEQALLEARNEVTRLKGLLDGYAGIVEGTFRVDFFNGETLHTTKVVAKNSSLVDSITVPEKEGFTFIGWSKDKTNVCDIYETITSDTTFYAMFERQIGLYDASTNEQKMTWQELIQGKYLTLTNGALGAAENTKKLAGKLILADEVKSLSVSCFYDCENLIEVDCPEVTAVALAAFRGCSRLRKVGFSEKLAQISGNYVFGNCFALKTIEIPVSVQSISKEAFASSYLVEIVNKSSVDVSKLENPLSLKFISIKESVLKTEGGVVYYEKNGFMIAAGLADYNVKEITLLSNCSEISDYAFAFSDNLQTVTISAGVRRIRGFAFLSCRLLKTMYIPETVTRIDLKPFLLGAKGFVLYIKSYPSSSQNWDVSWCASDEIDGLLEFFEVKDGYTYSEYLAEISA